MSKPKYQKDTFVYIHYEDRIIVGGTIESVCDYLDHYEYLVCLSDEAKKVTGCEKLIPVYEEKVYLNKRDAVKAMLERLKKSIHFYSYMLEKDQNLFDYFSDPNFQMRYMGEVLE
jgi:hypothetical protein